MVVMSLALAACGTTSTSTSSPSSATTSSGLLADGAYTLSQAPDAVACHSTVNALTLTVAGNVATVTGTPTGAVLTGAVARQGANFHVHIDNTKGGTFSIDLTGVADGLGGLTGKAQFDGINPGGETGYTCHFPFTGHGGPLTATSPPTAAAADLLAVVQLVYPKSFSLTGSATCSSDDPALAGCPFTARLRSTLSATIAGFVGHGGAYLVFWGGQNTPGDVLPTYVVTPDPSGGGTVVVDKNGDYDLRVQVTVISQGGRLLIDDIAYCTGGNDVYGQRRTC
jgi:hypothetical protein